MIPQFILNENSMKTTNDSDKEKNKEILLKFRKEILKWINELEFLQYERTFIEHLLGSHFLAISTPKLYQPTKELIKELKKVEYRGDELFVTVRIHKKRIASLIESSGPIDKLEIEHNRIKIEFRNYVINFKEVKKNIFDMIKKIMKKDKQKFIIKNQ